MVLVFTRSIFEMLCSAKVYRRLIYCVGRVNATGVFLQKIKYMYVFISYSLT